MSFYYVMARHNRIGGIIFRVAFLKLFYFVLGVNSWSCGQNIIEKVCTCDLNITKTGTILQKTHFAFQQAGIFTGQAGDYMCPLKTGILLSLLLLNIYLFLLPIALLLQARIVFHWLTNYTEMK